MLAPLAMSAGEFLWRVGVALSQHHPESNFRFNRPVISALAAHNGSMLKSSHRMALVFFLNGKRFVVSLGLINPLVFATAHLVAIEVPGTLKVNEIRAKEALSMRQDFCNSLFVAGTDNLAVRVVNSDDPSFSPIFAQAVKVRFTSAVLRGVTLRKRRREGKPMPSDFSYLYYPPSTFRPEPVQSFAREVFKILVAHAG